MLQRRPIVKDGYDWLSISDEEMNDLLHAPLEGLWFDVINNSLWWPEWGTKPASKLDQRIILEEVVNSAPRLVPLRGHRYLPIIPNTSGNPVLSIKQSDIIYYGANLEDWLIREHEGLESIPWPTVSRVPFWSDFIERPKEKFPKRTSITEQDFLALRRKLFGDASRRGKSD